MAVPSLYDTPPGHEARFEALLQLDTGTHHGQIVQLAATQGGSVLVSAGETTIRVWNAQTRTLERLLLGQVAGSTDERATGGSVRRFAISPNGLWLVALKTAAAGGTEVQVFELATGNLQARFLHADALLNLDFSANGRWLALAGAADSGKGRQRAMVWVLAARDVVQGGFVHAPLPVATLALGAWAGAEEAMLQASVRFVPQPGAGTGTPTATRALVAAVSGTRSKRAGQATHDQPGQLAWLRFTPGDGLHLERRTPIEGVIAAGTLSVNETWAVVGTSAATRRNRSGRLVWHAHAGATRGELLTEAPVISTAFSPSGLQLVAGLSADLVGGGHAPGDQTVQVNAYGCTPFEGLALRSSYYGHDSHVLAVGFLDEDTAVSAGGDDHAIHYWSYAFRVGKPLAAIRGVGKTIFSPGINSREQLLFGALPERLLPPGHAARQQCFDLRTMQLSTTAPSRFRMADYESRKWFILDVGAQVIPLRYSPYAYGAELDLPPDLSLFVGADDEWVIWSRSGYYDASAKGAQRIGYRINRGSDKEALFIPGDRFKAFYRPDLIAAIVKVGSEARARDRGVVIPQVEVAAILPPIVELRRQGLQVSGSEVRFSFSIESPCPAYPVKRIWILRNDRFVWSESKPKTGKRARGNQQHYSVTLPLRPGPNLFSIRAENEQARAVAVDHGVIGPTLDAAAERDLNARGHLFMLSVGVSDFEAEGTPQAQGYRRLRFAHQDATAVFNAFAGLAANGKYNALGALANAAFDAVEGHLLVNADATKSHILAALDALCTRMRQRAQASGAERDVLFVFLSGHGVRFKGEPDLYFWNHDMNLEQMEATGLSMLDLGDRITSVPGEVVLVVDACHSGMAGSNVVSGLDAEELARRVHAVNERGMYILNAARAEEKARESEGDGLGVFTAALLAATRSERFLVPENGPAGQYKSLGMLGLISALQQLVPQISARAGTRAQTPVCRVYGDLLPLTIYKTAPAADTRTPRTGAAALRPRAVSPNVPANADPSTPTKDKHMATKKTAPVKQAATKTVTKAAPAPVKRARSAKPDDGKGGADIVRQGNSK